MKKFLHSPLSRHSPQPSGVGESRTIKKLLLPPFVLALFAGGAWLLVSLKEDPERRPPKQRAPVVEFLVVEKENLRLYVDAYGSVRPRTSTTLLAETSGLIEGVAPFGGEEANRSGPAPSFRTGGFFEKGDLLVKLEDVELKAARAQANAALSRAELQLEQERAQAEQARAEWELDRNWTEAPPLVKRIPQIHRAETEVTAAQAALALSERNLNKARVRAPFRGRVLETMADVGQRVGAGASPALARVYDLKSGEIDFSLSRSELDLLRYGAAYANADTKPEVLILDEGGAAGHHGALERSEGVVSPRTLLTTVVARIDGCFANPFSPPSAGSPPPLRPGQFVKARILGPEVEVFVVPGSAFRERERLLVIDEEDRLHFRKVRSLKQANDAVWVEAGLTEGERICLTPLDVVAEGMKVTPTEERISDEE